MLCIIEWMVMFIRNVKGIEIGNCSINKNDDEPLLNNLNVKHALTLNYIRYAKWNGCISDCTGEVVGRVTLSQTIYLNLTTKVEGIKVYV